MDDRPESATGGGQFVEMPAGMSGINAALEDALLDEPAQTIGENSPRDVEVHLEVLEASYPVEGVAHDQQRPALADYFEGTCEPAVLTLIFLAEHPLILAHESSIIELSC